MLKNKVKINTKLLVITVLLSSLNSLAQTTDSTGVTQVNSDSLKIVSSDNLLDASLEDLLSMTVQLKTGSFLEIRSTRKGSRWTNYVFQVIPHRQQPLAALPLLLRQNYFIH